jgi:hypothetical protein
MPDYSSKLEAWLSPNLVGQLTFANHSFALLFPSVVPAFLLLLDLRSANKPFPVESST